MMTRALPAILASLLVAAPAASQSADVLHQNACDQGDLAACAVLATMLQLGESVPQDLPRAAGLFALACEGGDPEACLRLGRMYEDGSGVALDLPRARSRYRMACYGGLREGCDVLAMLDLFHPELEASLFARTIRVVDVETDQVLDDVLIEVPDLGVLRFSDADGHVVLRDMPEGDYTLRATRVGYRAVEGVLGVPGEATVVVQLAPLGVVAQSGPGAIVGRVIGELAEPLALVQVALVADRERAVVTDADGRFVLEGVSPGVAEVRITRLGYAPRSVELIVQPGGTVEIEATLSTNPIELAPIEVIAEARAIDLERSPFLENAGFYHRQARGFGEQFSRQYIEEQQPQLIYDMVRRVSGIRVELNEQTLAAYARNPRVVRLSPAPDLGFPDDDSCWLEIFIDGVRSGDYDINQISPFLLEGVEVYLGSDTPVQYQSMNPCGAILIWTRR